MIEWSGVAAHALWVGALAGLLAALSYLDWLARSRRVSRRSLLRDRVWRLRISGALLLFGLGVSLAAEMAGWERGLWVGATVWIAWLALWPRSSASG